MYVYIYIYMYILYQVKHSNYNNIRILYHTAIHCTTFTINGSP